MTILEDMLRDIADAGTTSRFDPIVGSVRGLPLPPLYEIRSTELVDLLAPASHHVARERYNAYRREVVRSMNNTPSRIPVECTSIVVYTPPPPPLFERFAFGAVNKFFNVIEFLEACSGE